MSLRGTGRAPALGLVLLSALWAISSLTPDLLPQAGGDTLSPTQRQAVLFSVFAVFAASIAVMRHLRFPRGRLALACAGVGLGLFVLPFALAALATGLSPLDRVAVFSLTPVFAVVLQPYLQGDHPPRGKAALAGSICAVAGILFLFPLNAPGSLRAAAALAALVAAALGIAVTNCFAVRLAQTIAGASTLPMAAQAGAVTALCFAVACVIAPHAAWRWSAFPPQLLVSLALDLFALLLLFWLMPRLAAARMTARFLVAPLLAILLGQALQPVAPPGRAWLGLLLLAGGAAWLVFAPAEPIQGSGPDPLHALIAHPSRRLPPN